MKSIPVAPNYTIDENKIVRNSKGKEVATKNGKVTLWSTEEKKGISYELSKLWAEVYDLPVPLDEVEEAPEFYENPLPESPWETPEEAFELPVGPPIGPLDPAWSAKRSKTPVEAVHAICKYIQAGHKARIVRELVMKDFPCCNFSTSLVADIKGGWLHHDIVKQYGIKPQHRSLKKKESANV